MSEEMYTQDKHVPPTNVPQIKTQYTHFMTSKTNLSLS